MSKKDNAPKHLHEHEETKFDSSTLVKMLKQLLPMIDKAKEEIKEIQHSSDEHEDHGHEGLSDIMLQPAMLPGHFEDVEDDDFVDSPATNVFKDDLGGCKGIKVIMLDPMGSQKIMAAIEKIEQIRTAEKLVKVRTAFETVKRFAFDGGGDNQINALRILDSLIKQADTDSEVYSFTKARHAILAGTDEHIDAAAYRLQNAFASNVKQPNVRIAYYENGRSQDGEPYQLCPKSKYQIGITIPMPISSCRDNCIDSRTTKDGQVSCAYQDWLKYSADNHISAIERLDEMHPEDNRINRLNLKDGERFVERNLAIDAMNFEQRMEEKLSKIKKPSRKKENPDENIESKLSKNELYGHQGDPEDKNMENRLRVASKHEGIDPSEEISFGAQLDAKRAKLFVDKPLGERLDEVSESNLGHHGEPEERMQDLSSRMAWNQSKFNKVDSNSELTFGEQLMSRHEVDENTAKTIEELLADAEHYYSDDEMEVLLSTLEELLSKHHTGY
jgi:hypothetical protein